MFNYNNIGSKIKGLAMAACLIEAIVSVIYGIAIMVANKDMILVGILVIILGPIIAWIASWLLYGFGQLVENSDIIARNSDIIAENSDIIALHK